jgi:hypothetical protein
MAAKPRGFLGVIGAVVSAMAQLLRGVAWGAKGYHTESANGTLSGMADPTTSTGLRWLWVLAGLAALAVGNVFWAGHRQSKQELRDDVQDFLYQLSWRRPRQSDSCAYWLGLTPTAKREALAEFFAGRADTLPQSRPLEEAVAATDARCHYIHAVVGTAR